MLYICEGISLGSRIWSLGTSHVCKVPPIVTSIERCSTGTGWACNASVGRIILTWRIGVSSLRACTLRPRIPALLSSMILQCLHRLLRIVAITIIPIIIVDSFCFGPFLGDGSTHSRARFGILSLVRHIDAMGNAMAGSGRCRTASLLLYRNRSGKVVKSS